MLLFRFNAEAVKKFLYSLNNGKIAKKRFTCVLHCNNPPNTHVRLVPEETSTELTGYGHNAVTCIGMKTDIPVILDEAIVKLTPDFFWLGGGEVDLKLGIRTSQLIRFVKPFIVSCSNNLSVQHDVVQQKGEVPLAAFNLRYDEVWIINVCNRNVIRFPEQDL